MATILDLLMALNRDELPPVPAPAQPVPMAPAPTGNVPEYGGPSQVTEPPQAPLDTRIIQQMLALRGQAPTAPAPLSRGQRIANALMGFGAGLEGRGGQFLQQLQEPQRRYEAQQQAYNNLGTELGIRGLETAQRKQEKETQRAQQVSDREFAAEVDREARRLKLTDQRELALFQDALLARRQREDDERAAKLAEQKDRAAKETQRNSIYQKLISENFAPAKVASELADNIVHGKPMSASTEKWRSVKEQKLTTQLARLNGVGGGGAASRRETQDLQRRTAQAAAGVAAMEKLARQAIESPEAERPPILNQMRSMAATLQAQFPEVLEVGEHNNWPFARLRPRSSRPSGGQRPQAQAKTITRAEMQALGVTEAQVKAEGYTITP